VLGGPSVVGAVQRREGVLEGLPVDLPGQHVQWVPLVQLVWEVREKAQLGVVFFFLASIISARFLRDKAIILQFILKNY
jgi:hypothetical protein